MLKKKLFAVGSFALLTTAITYHAIFNMLVQSQYPMVGALLPIATYLPFLAWRHSKKRQGSLRVTQGAGDTEGGKTA